MRLGPSVSLRLASRRSIARVTQDLESETPAQILRASRGLVSVEGNRTVETYLSGARAKKSPPGNAPSQGGMGNPALGLCSSLP